MSASNFPNLTTLPGYPLPEQREKVGLATKMDYGYVHGRKRYTLARKIFGLAYQKLSGYDKALLDAHIDEADVAETFCWRHPWTGVWYLAMYVDIPKIELVELAYWETYINLRSVRLAAIEDVFGDTDVWGDAMEPPIDVWGYS